MMHGQKNIKSDSSVLSECL